MRVKFIRNAAGYKKNLITDLDDITARVLIHRGYAVAHVETVPAVTVAPVAAPKKVATPKKPPTPRATKPKAMTAPKKAVMTAKKPGTAPRSRAKKNEYETKDLHAKSDAE